MRPSAPFRFLGAVVGGWVAFRVLALAPDWTAEAIPDVAAAEPPAAVATALASSPGGTEARPDWAMVPVSQAGWSPLATRASVALAFIPTGHLASQSFALVQPYGDPSSPPAPPGVPQLFPPGAASLIRTSRWTGSAWVFLRDGGDPALAPGGELGGGQAGARLTYRLLGRRAPLALSGRLYMPIERPEGAEAAVGLDWRPLPGIPVNILAERREALGHDGRSDFALTLYGGGERRVGPLRIEAWGQAGAVGIDDPDLFADGLVRATARLGPLDIGGGVWGGAQPGVSRLDAGPHVSARIPIRGVPVRVMGEWRFRVAGDAAPGSGPALTVASGF